MSSDKQPDFPREALARMAGQILELASAYHINSSAVLEWLSVSVSKAERAPETVAPVISANAKRWLEGQGVRVGTHSGARNMGEYRLAMKARGGR